MLNYKIRCGVEAQVCELVNEGWLLEEGCLQSQVAFATRFAPWWW